MTQKTFNRAFQEVHSHLLESPAGFIPEFQHKLLDNVIWIYLIAFIPAVIGSLTRITTTGWLPVYLLHITFPALLLTIFLLKSFVPYHWKVIVLIAIFYFISLAGMVTFGNLSSYNVFFGLSVTVCVIFFSLKASLWLIAFIILTQLSFAYSYGQTDSLMIKIISQNAQTLVWMNLTSFIAAVATSSLGIGWLYHSLKASLESLKVKNEQLEQAKAELTRLATTDPLTQLPNRRGLLKFSENAMAQYQRHHRPFCVLMLDIDHFKQVNDTLGHEAGDKVLADVARVLSLQVREYEIAARFGGEEFVLIAIDSSLLQGEKIAERVRAAVEEKNISFQSQSLSVTCSIGISTITPADTSFEQVLKRADLGVYQAKANGRNRVELYEDNSKQ
ncbi:GGDEF domain-containing protein [Thalassomonas actiniarum]|uniref:diguanylate cyclase n=1 Tax=Thalassomonas actiniarum TaxID=485447 RepID=A0AAF0C3C8_9GAMM|nr:GGDEF domain-containing protein [Thalassomonas actiniarum]WDD99442.1 GGDEF domain-containing protein [Thalassomonas actiniarum]